MSDDIYFYDFNLDKLYELPNFGVNKGYISVNVTFEFNDAGSLEFVFIDEKLQEIIKQHENALIVVWRDFHGFMTSYQFDNRCRVTGMSLNGLLHRIVIPQTVTTLSGDVETLARAAIADNAPWLTLGSEKYFETEVKYSTDTYKTADEYIRELLKLDNAGYRVYADFAKKKFMFEVLKSEERELMLSTNNRNAYDFTETYINKGLAYGGWYKQEQADDTDPVWTYITLDDTLSGVELIDTVLSATNEDEAMQELKAKSAKREIDLKTQKLTRGVDYNIGDIVRVQNGGTATKKRVTGFNMSKEKGFIENPILSEVE